MKRIILIHGLITGVIITAMMLYAVSMCYSNNDFEPNAVAGYAAQILAFSLIFVGVRTFRNKYNDGVISFGKALKIGLYITLIASSMYVGVWLIDYYLFVPDFMDQYTAFVLKQAKSGGAGEAELSKKAAEMAKFKEMYKNPLFVILISYLEIIPVGLVVSLITALLLKRKLPQQPVPAH